MQMDYMQMNVGVGITNVFNLPQDAVEIRFKGARLIQVQLVDILSSQSRKATPTTKNFPFVFNFIHIYSNRVVTLHGLEQCVTREISLVA